MMAKSMLVLDEVHHTKKMKLDLSIHGSYIFDIEVIEKGTNLSMPVANLRFKDIKPGIQSFSLSLEESGNFTLVISDKEHSTLIFICHKTSLCI